ncbi:MAG: molybdopterin-dependent oxidoreductase, partial [Pseudomonadota bacterium]
VFVASVLPTRLDDVAAGTCTLAPAAWVRCGRAIAAALTTGDLDPTELGDAERVFATAAALALRDARQPLIVTGTSLGEPALVETAGAIARTLRETGRAASLAVCGSEANSFGMRQLPQLDQHVEDALQAVVDGRAQTLLVLQNDLFRRADAGLVTAALEAAKHVIVLDCLDTPTATAAEIVLPAATIPETTGTLVNYERRAQRFYQVFEAGDDIQPAWRWLTAIGRAAGRNELDWMHVDDLVADMAAAANLDAVATAGPDASYRAPWGQRIPREPHRYSGRTAMYADRTLHEPKSTVDEETPFSYSMEGANSEQPAGMLPYVWAPGWNSNQSLIKFQEEVGGALRGADLSALLRAPDVPPVPYYTGSAAEQPNADQFILVAQPVLFGGEELSAQAPAIQERAPRPFIVLNGTDAARLGVADGDGVRCGGHSLEVRTAAAMAPGTAAVSAGMPGAPAHLSPGPAALAGDPDFVRQPSIIARG